MSVLNLRDVLPFPGGANSSDIFLNGQHLNLTTLEYWNYTLFSNGTLSNNSWCFMTDLPFTPGGVLENGTFINATSCYTPTKAIGTRSAIGVGYAVAFGICLVLILINLTRHGKLYLPVEKRFYPIGRRWQWYWGCFVCATAIIGLFFGIDVDRYYIQDIPIVINVFFWFLMQMGTTALVWEAVRHWGSWMERQFIDPNPFVLHDTDRRWMFEFWIPLFFYFWLWMNFFMVIPRNWEPIIRQRSPQQTIEQAEPTATDGRFKAAAFILVICWGTIIVSIWHSIRHYEPRNRGWFNRTIGFLGYMPFRFALEIPLLLALIAYQILCSFRFRLSPLNAEDTNYVAMYLGGYTPSLLILIIQIIDGFMRPNEDRELIRQRRMRGEEINRELGIAKKPAWWRRVNGQLPPDNMADQVLRNVREVGGGRPTARHVEVLAEQRAAQVREGQTGPGRSGATIEMNELRRANSVASSMRARGAPPPPYTLYTGKSTQRKEERIVQAAAGMLFPNSTTPPAGEDRARASEGEMAETQQRPEASERSRSIGSTGSGLSTTGPPQQIRSMLDI
ncbi:hypothetical protein DL770_006105 [Monosporascus sp. CRB-9-2]|nr:hypothetical protein DL770_006105 [Monosporascus sp. CRB-9-2]